MLKFFDTEEQIPETQRDKIKNQKLDGVTKCYDNNYGNCILPCTHKKKFDQNIHIPRIIHARL